VAGTLIKESFRELLQTRPLEAPTIKITLVLVLPPSICLFFLCSSLRKRDGCFPHPTFFFFFSLWQMFFFPVSLQLKSLTCSRNGSAGTKVGRRTRPPASLLGRWSTTAHARWCSRQLLISLLAATTTTKKVLTYCRDGSVRGHGHTVAHP